MISRSLEIIVPKIKEKFYIQGFKFDSENLVSKLLQCQIIKFINWIFSSNFEELEVNENSKVAEIIFKRWEIGDDAASSAIINSIISGFKKTEMEFPKIEFIDCKITSKEFRKYRNKKLEDDNNDE